MKFRKNTRNKRRNKACRNKSHQLVFICTFFCLSHSWLVCFECGVRARSHINSVLSRSLVVWWFFLLASYHQNIEYVKKEPSRTIQREIHTRSVNIFQSSSSNNNRKNTYFSDSNWKLTQDRRDREEKEVYARPPHTIECEYGPE